MNEQKLSELLDKEAIRELRYKWAQGLDYQDWASLESLFLEEVDTDFTAWGLSPQKLSRADLIDSFKHNLSRDGLKTQHIFTNFRIEVTGDTATSNFYQLAQHFIKDFEGGEEFFLRAEYRDSLVRTANGWKISGVTLVAIFYTTGNPHLLAD